MRKLLIAGFAVTAASLAQAAGPTLEPGLWEVRLVKQVVDGRDVTAQIAQAATRMQQALASMPPAQRERIEAMMKQRGAETAGSGRYRICISPAMAKQDAPILDRTGRCKPTQVTRSGDRTSFAFSCTSGGITTTGTGVTTSAAHTVTTQLDATVQEAGAKHVMHSESEMKLVGPDCGAVKPFDAQH